MAGMAISVLWFLIGLIVLAGVIYLAIWVIENFIFPIPEQVKEGNLGNRPTPRPHRDDLRVGGRRR